MLACATGNSQKIGAFLIVGYDITTQLQFILFDFSLRSNLADQA